MCGICGELRFDGQAPDLDALARMNQALRRRGPDHEGVWHTGAVAFGQRRLAVIDLSSAANQPMVDEALQLTLVFNGTIYNYPALRKELIGFGYSFFSQGDTEVVLKAYHRWGESCVERFRGMFAFAIWDSKARCLFLARDRMGIKPLYFASVGGCLRFASNTQALLAAGGIDTHLDPVALHHLFTLHAVVPAPRTILSQVRKIAPAETMTVASDGTLRRRSYWQLRAERPLIPRTEQEWTEVVHEALREAVQQHLAVADVPVGVLLSGGIDSSLLVALLAESGVRSPLTFSIGFEDTPEERGSEFEYSDQVAERFQTDHHRIVIPNAEVLDRLPEAVAQMGEPMFGQDAVAFYLLAERVSHSVKVVQSGQGADEVFGGYFWYPKMVAARGTALERFRDHYFDRDHAEYLTTVAEAFHGPDHTSEYIEQRLALPHADTFLDQVLRLDVTTLLVDDPVKRVDNMTMAWGVEARVPFLDHPLVECAAAVPPEWKLNSGGKHLLKRMARGLLPNAVIDRPKGYFPVPALKYVRGPFLHFMREVLTSRACLERGLYQRSYVEKLLNAPEQYLTRIQGSKVWHLAALELWLQIHVDNRAPL